MMHPASLTLASARLAQRVLPYLDETLAYQKANGISAARFRPTASDAVGLISFADIVDCGNHHLEFGRPGEEAIPGIVLEALGADGETVVDLVAWPVDRPEHVMTMFGSCGFLGTFAVTNPASYYMGFALPLFRTPLEFLQVGCVGAVPIVLSIAAWTMFSMPEAKFEPRDTAHKQWLEVIRHSVMPRDQIKMPVGSTRRAA
jgi:hypothetical protein